VNKGGFMEYKFDKEVRLFMVFDILGDIERTGPLLWKIDRKRLEDVKNHILDLIIITRILRKYFPSYLDFDLIYDYILCHDLSEAITGDITKFEGVSEEEIKRVTKTSIDFLSKTFNDVIDFEKIINGYENRIDIESKVVHMLDKLHSSTTFMKYQSEQSINMDNPDIIFELRNHPFVVKKIAEGKDLADIFFEFHFMALNITDEECKKYKVSRHDADLIVNAIRAFANEIYSKKINKTLLVDSNEFPTDAMIYNRNIKK
jgi:5'-deoxynucleotidase YfbR-like HD superfamily hydrolase